MFTILMMISSEDIGKPFLQFPEQQITEMKDQERPCPQNTDIEPVRLIPVKEYDTPCHISQEIIAEIAEFILK